MRQVRRIGQPVLTEALKAAIRRLAARGMPQHEIAREVGLSQTTVSRVLNGQR